MLRAKSALATLAPDDLVEQVRSATQAQDLDQFFIDAARRQVRQIRARQLREEYVRTHEHRTPRQVYESNLSQARAFETRYGLPSEQFLREFESGELDEDSNDWVAFYRWRTLAYGLRHLEKEYGYTREAQADDSPQP